MLHLPGPLSSFQSDANTNRLLKAILDELRRGNAGSIAENSSESSPSNLVTRRQSVPVLPPLGSTGTDLNEAFAINAFHRLASGSSLAGKASK